MPARPRILVLRGAELLRPDDVDLVEAADWADALRRLNAEPFDALLLAAAPGEASERAGQVLLADRVITSLADGLAILDFELRILWANRTFERWCGGPARGRSFYEALGSPRIGGPETAPLHTALVGQSVTKRLHREGQTLELHITPLLDDAGKITQLLTLVRDVTADMRHQQQLEALYQAGRELTALPADQLGEMSVEERIEFLKQNIRRFTHDLLHYDVVEVRLLDPQTGRLEPLLIEGMTPEASERRLEARAEGHGVTGFVATSGKSYVCPDTAHDPLYLEGAKGMRSSLTVPLVYQDEVIGTFNVESPKLDSFGEEDVQFLEVFAREIAAAIHTLELLTAEKRGTTTHALDAVYREVALPVDDILNAGAALLERYIGHDPEMADKIRLIVSRARLVKQSIQKVGEDLTPPEPAPRPGDRDVPALKGTRVLVADNDDRVRRSAHGLLGRWGCVVETARDGREALAMARLSSYDAILADIRLPDVSGYDAYRQLREAQPRARVVLMTTYGYDPSHSLVKARQDGLKHVLFKPFRVDQLRDALAGVHRNDE